ncbi:hypothetical protein IF2G_10837 [Cordyceps javanica]|nr:hypothetical protein IF2G_10837 [Cordyceps javanica]
MCSTIVLRLQCVVCRGVKFRDTKRVGCKKTSLLSRMFCNGKEKPLWIRDICSRCIKTQQWLDLKLEPKCRQDGGQWPVELCAKP